MAAHDWFVLTIGTAILMAFVCGFGWFLEKASPWRADDRNPYRRYCKECGTGQSLWIGAGCGVNGKWETFLPVNPCSSHHENDD